MRETGASEKLSLASLLPQDRKGGMMDIIKTDSQFVVRPDNNGFALYLTSNNHIQLGIKLCIYPIPYIFIHLPFLEIEIEWFHRANYNKFNEIFRPSEEEKK